MIKGILWEIIKIFPPTTLFFETRDAQTPITFKMWFLQKVMGFNKKAYWPMHFTSIVSNVKNIYAGVDTSPGYSPGCYIQGGGKVYIGDYTQIAPNVGIISSNHDLYDSRKKIVSEVRIGKYCWIGMNAVILPNVTIGDFTIVGAGAIVTKSFPEGFGVIAGNPARLVKKIDRSQCIPFKNHFEYNGYIKSESFNKFRVENLNV